MSRIRSFNPLVAPAALLLLVCPLAAHAGEADSFAVAAAPAWVKPASADTGAAAPEGAARDGVYELLRDRQVRVAGRSTEDYVHVARKIVSAGGVSSASELRFDFEPPYQSLVLHHVRIVRDGRAEDALRPREIHVIQQETELSQRVYNGTLTAVAFLRDVRVGDVIDYAFSIRGRNPVLGDRFSDTFALAAGAPVSHRHLRLVVPSARSLFIAPRAGAGQPVERADGATREYEWDLRDTPGVRLEDALPRWFNPVARVEVTEYQSWAEVAAWAVPLFTTPSPRPSPALAALIDKVRAAAPDARGRLFAALRFVQDDIRYLAIAMGPSSHQPQPPSTVLERRFGDCKDKTLLLVTILRALGIEAQPALVNPDLGRGLDERLPSPLAFDHVIVRASIDGRAYWLDPTLTGQRGPLEVIESAGDERALVVAPETRALTTISPSDPAQPFVEAVEDVDASRYGEPASLRVTTTYRAGAADAMRREIETSGRAEVSRRYLEHYAREEPTIVEAAPLAVTDDPDHATLTVVESYRIPGFWREETKWFTAGEILDHLPTPSVTRRTMPLAVRHPTFVAHETHVVMPDLDPIETGPLDLADDAMALHCDRSRLDRAVSIRCQLRTRRDAVPAAQVEDHLRLAARMREALAYGTTPRASRRARDDDPTWKVALGVALGCIGLIGLLFGAPKLLRLRWFLRKRAFTRKLSLDAGEAPATAIAVPSREEAERKARKARCVCGEKLDDAPLDVGDLVLGERTITAVRATCRACGETRRSFFEVRAASAAG